MSTDCFINHFLIAMPRLSDPSFAKSVIYICEHSEEGAMGLVINKPMQINLGSVLEHLKIETANEAIDQQPVLMGGPVGQEHGFVIHNPLTPSDDPEELVQLSSSKEILRAIGSGKGPDDFIVMLGYAGWDAGQLEQEIHRDDWLVAPINLDIFFHTPIEQRWQSAAQLIGVDINTLSGQVGHA